MRCSWSPTLRRLEKWLVTTLVEESNERQRVASVPTSALTQPTPHGSHRTASDSARGFSGSDSPESGHPSGRDPRLVSQGTSDFLHRNSLNHKMPKRHQPGTGSCSLEATRNM